jgi:hypothetical protein
MNFFHQIILDFAAERCLRASRALFRMNAQVWHASFCVFIDIPPSPALVTTTEHSSFLFRNQQRAARTYALSTLDRSDPLVLYEGDTACHRLQNGSV